MARTTVVIMAIVFLSGLIGVGGVRLGVPTYILTFSWAALLLVHIRLSMRPDRFRSLIGRVFGPLARSQT